MPFTNDNQLETLASGQADWDTGLNANFQIIERGHHITANAGIAVVSGQVCSVRSGGWVVPYDARSSNNPLPAMMAMQAVSSGAAGMFLATGTVRSMSIWSGFLTVGEPVFIAINSPGFLVSSYAGAMFPVGVALAANAVMFRPGHPVLRLIETHSISVGPVLVGTFADFQLPVGRAATIRDLTITGSHDKFKVQFWSGSSRVSSELQYETLTTSWGTGSSDVKSNFLRDRAMFPHDGTDANSAWNIYGRLTAQSGTAVGSAAFTVRIIAERVR